MTALDKTMMHGQPNPNTNSPTTPYGLAAAAPLQIKQVLFVDDNEELLTLYKELLEAANYVVTIATDGVYALSELMKIDVDAIICDLMMENLDGPMFYMAVERIKSHLCPRFIFITGKQQDPSVAAFVKKTDAPLLTKPVTIDRLTTELEWLLERNQPSRKIKMQ